MPNHESELSAAFQLPVSDRLQSIDDQASAVPVDPHPQPSESWLREIKRRSAEINSGVVVAEAWSDVRSRLFEKHGVIPED